MRPDEPLPAEVVAALRRSNSADAVSLLHKATGMPVDEAKAIIDARLERSGKARGTLGAMLGLPFAVSAALRRGDKAEAIRLMRERGGLSEEKAKEAVAAIGEQAEEEHRSPGEVSRASGGLGWLALLLAAGVAAYFFFAR